VHQKHPPPNVACFIFFSPCIPDACIPEDGGSAEIALDDSSAWLATTNPTTSKGSVRPKKLKKFRHSRIVECDGGDLKGNPVGVVMTVEKTFEKRSWAGLFHEGLRFWLFKKVYIS